MGSVSALDSGAVDVVVQMSEFLDEPDNIALCESVMAPKPEPRPYSQHLRPGEIGQLNHPGGSALIVAMGLSGCSVQ